jgi:hypothetical protein
MMKTSIAVALISALMLTSGVVSVARAENPVTACGTIDAPGSYIVTNNLVGPDTGDCLLVTSSFVTIDLGGFQIACQPNALNGINAPGFRVKGLVVRNGMITGCFNGIDASVAPDSIIERIVALDNDSFGIAVAASSTVKGNVASGNQNGGIFVICPSNIIENTSTGNGGPNLSTEGVGCNIVNNVAP